MRPPKDRILRGRLDYLIARSVPGRVMGDEVWGQFGVKGEATFRAADVDRGDATR